MPQSEEIRALSGSVDNLAAQVQDEKDARTREEKARRETRNVAVAAAALVIAAVILFLLGLLGQVHRTNDAVEQITTDRNEARTAACEQFNAQTERSRDGNKSQIRVVFGFLTGTRVLSTDEKSRLDELYRLHDAEIDKAFPLRTCDAASIEAYYSAKK